MRFQTRSFCRELRFSLGTDVESGDHCLAIPVTIGVVDYAEYYRLTPAQYDTFLADPSSAQSFLDDCRNRRNDDLLVVKPGWNRGIPY